jgi:TonB family protein
MKNTSSVKDSSPISLDTTNALPALTNYARMVQEKISKSISYPSTAIGAALDGTVKLKLRILKDGSLGSAEVIESSGNVTLDEDAVQAARSASPYDAFTTGMNQQDLVFTVPIVYNKLVSASAASANKVIAAY